MDLLEIIPSTSKSVGVKFSPEGILHIFGVSCEEDPKPIYQILKSWIEGYLLSPSTKTTLSVKLKYFNTASAKYLLDLLESLVLLNKSNSQLSIVWYFEKGDEDMQESIILFEELIKHKIEQVQVESYNN